MKRFGIVNILLVALILLAGWRLFDVLRLEAPAIPADPAGARSPAFDVPGPVRRPPVKRLVKGIRTNDLFDVSRQPPEVKTDEPEPEQTPAPPPTLKLSGVIFVGDFREAVVIDEAQGRKQLRLREGEEISGYEVVSIARDRVALRSGQGEEVQLQLLVDTSRRNVRQGPGGAATPRPKVKTRNKGADQDKVRSADAQSDIEKRRADARKRAQRARERLKRLREEAAKRK